MNKNNLIIFLVISIIILSSFTLLISSGALKNIFISKNNLKDEIIPNQTVIDTSNLEPVTYTISSAKIVEDKLVLNVTYAGGCKDHNFSIVFSDTFLESYPVQNNVVVTHDNNGDYCKALIQKTFSFDLTPLKNLYIEYYHETTGIIQLNLKYYNEPLIYNF